MMRKYVAMSKSPRSVFVGDDLWDYFRQHQSSIVAITPDSTPRPTGLYDQHGTPLFAVGELTPLGFDLTKSTK